MAQFSPVISSFLLLLQAAHPLAVAEDFTRPEADVLHYDIALNLTDSTESIRARATIRYAVAGGGGRVGRGCEGAVGVNYTVGPGARIPAASASRGGSGGARGWQRRRTG